jgi:hypothetical protein
MKMVPYTVSAASNGDVRGEIGNEEYRRRRFRRWCSKS